MALTIGDLVGYIRADDSGMQRGLDSAEDRMRGFQRDAEGRLRTLNGRFATVGEQIAAGLRPASEEGDRAGLSLGRLAGMAGGLGRVAGAVGGIAARLGSAVPLAAGLAATVGQIAPAAGLAATGIFAVVLASQALKLGMKGVGDAISAAMDPSDPEAYAEALKKLAPSARAFVTEVRALQPQLKALQQGVQQRLFEGFDGILKTMGKTTLPVVKRGLIDSAGALNLMGRNLGNAAIGLSTSGTLGKAIGGATAGLRNMSRIPAQIVVGLTQVAAAAAPSFAAMTDWAGDAVDRLSEKMTKSFFSGGMQKAIDQAIVVIGDLVEVAGNVGSAVGSIFSAAQVSGGGFIGVLKEISGALADAFSSPAVQSGLKAIFETMAVAARTVAPLLVSALQAIGPVFAALGPPVQTLIRALGTALQPVIRALGPVLAVAASAVGTLVTALSPLLPAVGQLVAALLPALTPILTMLQRLFAALAPVIAQLATTLVAMLTPVLAALVPLMETVATTIGGQLVLMVEMLGQTLIELSPSLILIGQSLAELLVALTPVIAQMGLLGTTLMMELLPILTPLIEGVAVLAAIFADELAATIQGVVIPALQLLMAILQGDFSAAWEATKRLVSGAADHIVRMIAGVPGRVFQALGPLAGQMGSRATEAGGRLVSALSGKIGEAVRSVGTLPGRARSALGSLGGYLYASGQSLIQGFINGITSKIGDLVGTVTGVLSTARDLLPFSPAKRGPFSGKGWTLYSGQSITTALAEGIRSRQGAVVAAAGGMLGAAQGALGGSLGTPGIGGLPGMALAGAAGVGTSAGGGQQRIVLEVRSDGGRAADLLVEEIRDRVAVLGGGSVQRAFGQ